MSKYVNRLFRLLDPEFYEPAEEIEVGISDVNANNKGEKRTSVISVFHNFWVKQQSSTVVLGSDIHLPSENRQHQLQQTIPVHTGEPTDGKILSSKSLTHCLSFLRPRDLKNCRLVCRFWKTATGPVFKNKTCVVINGEDTGSLFEDGVAEKCLSYLRHSVSKFSLWTCLRLRRVKDYQIMILVCSRDFQIAAKSISELELLSCDISWKALLKIMKQFINLQSLVDHHSVYRNPQEYHWLKRWRYMVISKLRKVPSPVDNFVKKGVCLEDLKSLALYKTDCGPNTTNLIEVLTVTTMDLEEFHLKADPRAMAQNIRENFEFERRLNVLFLMSSHSLKRLSIDMMDTNYIDHFNVFLQSFKDWSSPLTKKTLVLEKLSLKFKYVWLSRNFETILIPFVSKLQSLRRLKLGLIAFKAENAHLLSRLKTALPSSCEFEFGLFISDHDYRKKEREESHTSLEDSMEQHMKKSKRGSSEDHDPEKERNIMPLKETRSSSLFFQSQSSLSILRANLYQENMTDLLISVFHDDITGLKDLLPHDIANGKFEKTQGLSIFIDGSRPKFSSFSIKIICHNFTNLSRLEIVDGPWEIYFQQFFTKVSEAFIGDHDLQMILKNLVRLQTLMIFANMANLTDTGVTGMTTAACYRMRTTNDYGADMSKEFEGFSFANLQELRYLSLRGIGDNLTDVSVHWGFAIIPHLETLIIANFPKISPDGRKKLDKMYPATEGRFVAII